MSDQFLEHYGVIGMKWGKRKARYTTTKSNNSQPQNKKPFDTTSAKNNLNAGRKLANDGAKKLSDKRKAQHNSTLKKEAKKMSDAELRRIADRIALEQRYVNMMKQDGIKDAKSNLEKTLDVIGTITTTAVSAITVYEAIQKLK